MKKIHARQLTQKNIHATAFLRLKNSPTQPPPPPQKNFLKVRP